ncbi:MAG: VCBS repeat-containing protein [Candidatus Zixiibacteriota bacterium]
MRKSKAVPLAAAVIVTVVACAISSAPAQAQDFCLETAVNYAAGDAPYSVFAVDLDGDGDADLAVANGNSNNVSVLKNNGDGTFVTTAVNFPAGDEPTSVIAADFDGDGAWDLAVANNNGDNISVLINCAPPPCQCPCHGDPQCDGVPNVQDVVKTVDVAFRGAAPIFDPLCPREQTDVNCDGVSTVQDVVKMVNVAFRGASKATEYCDPCAP